MQLVISSTAIKAVITSAAIHKIIMGTAIKHIITGLTEQNIAAISASDIVASAPAKNPVIACPGDDYVIKGLFANRCITFGGNHLISQNTRILAVVRGVRIHLAKPLDALVHLIVGCLIILHAVAIEQIIAIATEQHIAS